MEQPLFSFSSIAYATANFSLDNKLGEGGFGAVYKGMLEDGQEIAVKRLSKNSSQGINEFKNEVICISKLQHRNLVKLIGCCIHGDEKLLIYEYMPNKSLDSNFLLQKLKLTKQTCWPDKDQSMPLDWTKRVSIIKGIARGLLEVLEEMKPKQTQREFGYMSPEYALDGLFSIKSDVYSFGILLLEILSGKRNRGFIDPENKNNLIEHVLFACGCHSWDDPYHKHEPV
ncbi:hypothetical protein M8C21_020967, partial [Ambrosia artemisiifolia]